MSIEQIEKMRVDVLNSIVWKDLDDSVPALDIDSTTENLHSKGYRKQSEGEWESFEIPHMMRCSVCNVSTLDIHRQYFNFCPNCGAKMKGGAE